TFEYLVEVNRIACFLSVQHRVCAGWRQHDEALIRIRSEVIRVIDEPVPITVKNGAVIQFDSRRLDTGTEHAPLVHLFVIAAPTGFLLILTDGYDVFPHRKAGRR